MGTTSTPSTSAISRARSGWARPLANTSRFSLVDVIPVMAAASLRRRSPAPALERPPRPPPPPAGGAPRPWPASLDPALDGRLPGPADAEVPGRDVVVDDRTGRRVRAVPDGH